MRAPAGCWRQSLESKNATARAAALPPGAGEGPRPTAAGTVPLDRFQVADVLAVALRAGVDRLTAPLARAVRAFTDRTGWREFGYARQADWSRERLGRSVRWVRDMAALGRGLEQLPGLGASLIGDDDGPPLGRVAALLITKVASPQTVVEWVARARDLSVRELRETVAAARRSGSDRPDQDPISQVGSSGPDTDEPELSDRRLVRLPVPSPLRGAFDECLDLYRAVAGTDATVTSFAEALVAEAYAGTHPPDSDASPMFARPGRDIIERALARTTVNWSHLVDAAAAANALDGDIQAAANAPHRDIPAPIDAPDRNTPAPIDALDRDLPDAVDPLDRDAADPSDPHRALPDASNQDVANGKANDLAAVPHDIAHWDGARLLSVARHVLAQLLQLERQAGSGGPRELERQIRALVQLEETLERTLGRLLADMSLRRAWPRLRFAGIGHYTEERLRLSRTSGESRVRLERALDRYPRIRAAYEAGRIGCEAALHVVRVLDRRDTASADAVGEVRALEDAWLQRAEGVTVKRLRDEIRERARRWAVPDDGLDPVVCRRGVAGGGAAPGEALRDAACSGTAADAIRDEAASAAEFRGRGSVAPACRWADSSRSGCPGAYPLSDAEWHASLCRKPGDFLHRTRELGDRLTECRHADDWLCLRLPPDVADSFLATIESGRRLLEQRANSVPWDASWPEADPPASLRAARLFAAMGRRLPAWVGLLAMLEDFAATWDDPRGHPRRHGDRIYRRDGWRCTAPGCTSRHHLEDHHLEYRSRGGGDHTENRTCLCWFHHREGEHGELASCRGEAPLGIVWTLGRNGAGGRFTNERRL